MEFIDLQDKEERATFANQTTKYTMASHMALTDPRSLKQNSCQWYKLQQRPQQPQMELPRNTNVSICVVKTYI